MFTFQLKLLATKELCHRLSHPVLLSERSWEDHPEAVYEDSDIGECVTFLDMLLLEIWVVVFFMGAYFSFSRYDLVG